MGTDGMDPAHSPGNTGTSLGHHRVAWLYQRHHRSDTALESMGPSPCPCRKRTQWPFAGVRLHSSPANSPFPNRKPAYFQAPALPKRTRRMAWRIPWSYGRSLEASAILVSRQFTFHVLPNRGADRHRGPCKQTQFDCTVHGVRSSSLFRRKRRGKVLDEVSTAIPGGAAA